jgi:hypothetical protein
LGANSAIQPISREKKRESTGPPLQPREKRSKVRDMEFEKKKSKRRAQIQPFSHSAV